MWVRAAQGKDFKHFSKGRGQEGMYHTVLEILRQENISLSELVWAPFYFVHLLATNHLYYNIIMYSSINST